MAFEQLSRTIADNLLADLKAGKLEKIGIDEIHDACETATGQQLSHRELGVLTEMTVRRVVEAAA